NWMRASVEAAGISLEDMQTAATLDFSGDMHAGSKAWKHVWSAGQGVGGVTARETFGEIVSALRVQYKAAVEEQARGSRYLKT
ncbi:nitronate monooxygenase, partial [Sulfitobacter sp.]|nr:nitronate monooxygenase [Sulfitobacter sp.]